MVDYNYITHQNAYPPNSDILFQKLLWLEYYERFPLLTYRALDRANSSEDTFYLDATRNERAYTDYLINIRQATQSEEQNLTLHGIKNPKQRTVYICVPQFEPLGILPQIGDVFLFEFPDQEWEIMTVKHPDEARFASSLYYFELELTCERPELGK